MRHVVIIPARDEEAFIAQTLDSLLNQTVKADLIVIVDDDSTDATAEIVRDYARQDSSIMLLSGPPRNGRAYRVVEVFNLGYDTVRDQDFEFVSKLDADMIFPPDYFERLLEVFDRDPGVGIASGSVNEIITGETVRLRMPENHVPGMVKTIRRKVFDAMGGFLPVLGWDIIDQVQIRHLGYRGVRLEDLETMHLRRHASAEGILRGNMRMGHGAYIIGTHPLFMIGRSVYRMLETPYVLGGLALGLGYLRAWLMRTPQIEDRSLIETLRREQMHRLFHRNRLPQSELRAAE